MREKEGGRCYEITAVYVCEGRGEVQCVCACLSLIVFLVIIQCGGRWKIDLSCPGFSMCISNIYL